MNESKTILADTSSPTWKRPLDSSRTSLNATHPSDNAQYNFFPRHTKSKTPTLGAKSKSELRVNQAIFPSACQVTHTHTHTHTNYKAITAALFKLISTKQM